MEGTVKRARAAGFIGAIVLTTVLVAPGAQAASNGRQSTSCTFTFAMKFKPGLVQGSNQNAFAKFRVNLTGCTGGTVASATGYGGTIGDLKCDSGRISGRAAAKAQLFWDTGDSSALNFFFRYRRASLHGQVVDGLYKGEDVGARNFSFTPKLGDCAESPLVRAKVTGTLGL
jgi:hypothetical protein